MVLSGIYYVEGGILSAVGQEIIFWSKEIGVNDQAASSMIVWHNQIIFSDGYRKKRGYSVRCTTVTFEIAVRNCYEITARLDIVRILNACGGRHPSATENSLSHRCIIETVISSRQYHKISENYTQSLPSSVVLSGWYNSNNAIVSSRGILGSFHSGSPDERLGYMSSFEFGPEIIRFKIPIAGIHGRSAHCTTIQTESIPNVDIIRTEVEVVDFVCVARVSEPDVVSQSTFVSRLARIVIHSRQYHE